LLTGAEATNLAVEAVVEAGIGGHFFATATTMQRYRDAFYTPLETDWRN
jgi:trimethylamine--corrinoid protein Co-methyltransferase